MNLSALLTAMLVGSTINQSTATPKSISAPKNGVPPQSKPIPAPDKATNSTPKKNFSSFSSQQAAKSTATKTTSEDIFSKIKKFITENAETLKLILVGLISGLIGIGIGTGKLQLKNPFKQEDQKLPTDLKSSPWDNNASKSSCQENLSCNYPDNQHHGTSDPQCEFSGDQVAPTHASCCITPV
jgi:gas vesicle protein